MYLVLRVCRACNHRGTAKRPSTPSHSASRHSIFFSPRPRTGPSSPGHHRLSFPGARTSPLSRRAVVVSFSPLRRIALSRRRFVTSMRPFYNHYRFSQLDRGCAPRLSLSLSPFFIFIPSALRFPRRACLPTHLSLASRIPLLSITDGPTKRRRWDDAQKTSRGGNLLPRRARASALILDLARTLRGTDCIYL